MNVAALYVYPIKSCAGVEVRRAEMTRRGLAHDRRYMVADLDGAFLSQRTFPELQRIKLAIGREPAGDRLIARREDLPPLLLPPQFSDGPRVPYRLWDDTGTAVRHDEGSAWFSRALAAPVQLLSMPDDVRRAVDREYGRDGDLVSFADGYPVLVLNAASLADLNTRSGAANDVMRFRPNLVVAGAAAWAEDDWRRLRAGAVTLRTPKPCERCSIPSIDPSTLAITKEPLRTLALFRARDKKVHFCMNAIPDELGVISVGDEVVVLPEEDGAALLQ